MYLSHREQVDRLDTGNKARRNPSGMALAVLFFVAAAACTWLVWTAGGWWWLTAPVLLFLWLFGIVGLAQSAVVVPRAANGQSLEFQARRAAKAGAKLGV